MSNAQSLGAWGEEVACWFLKKHSYKILERNSRYPAGELDILAWIPDPQLRGFFKLKKLLHSKEYLRAGTLVLVEVKTREIWNEDTVLPELRVDYKRKQKLIQGAYHFLRQYKMNDETFRIDVISVVLNRTKKSTKIRHIKSFE